jgi:hemerythrin-like metal-binding protein
MSPWQPSLSTGIEDIDAQHRGLFDRIEALEEAIAAGEPGSRLEDLFGYLARYAAEHFAAEERAMWEAGYPGLDVHWSLHLSFATELARRKADYLTSRTRASILIQLARWMDGWLEEHLLGADAEMARHLRAHANGPIPSGAR